MDSNLYKQLKMDTFLKQIQLLSKTKEINPKQIYVQLISQGIPEIERKQDLSRVFESLQELNKNNEKMDVFVAPYWSYFCQFVSKNAKSLCHLNPIKIYVPLKPANIEDLVQKIFKFINENNIEHCSKLASNVRVDNLVIRVYNQNDADKIIEYINNDKELVNNMYNPNPFSIESGKVGLAMDRNLSYNVTLSKYIYNYITEVNNQSLFASYDGFRFYLKEQLRTLKNREDLSEQIKMCEGDDYEVLPQFLQNLEEITTIIVKNMEGDSKESLYKYFEQVNEESYNEEKANEYYRFDYSNMINENYELLKEIVTIIAMKYGYNTAKQVIEFYKNTGDENYITRTNNAREKVVSAKTFRTYLKIIDLDMELEKIIPKVEENKVEPSKETILEEVCKSTYRACQVPERGYCGKTQVARALIRMQVNDYNCITRKNDARYTARENIKPEEIRNIIKNSLEANGYIIENEADLYELYATHIEYLCNVNKKVGEHSVRM